MKKTRRPTRSHRTRSHQRRRSRRAGGRKPDRKAEGALAERRLREVFTEKVVNELRAETGYNPRQRHATAYRLLTVVLQAYLFGQTLRFSRLRAFFVKAYGPIRPRAFQLRFKSEAAAAFFRAAFERLVHSVVSSTTVSLEGKLAMFRDVVVYDGTCQRVPPRGRSALPSTVDGRAGAKWLVGYSLKTGLVEQAAVDAETRSELPMWRKLVGDLQPQVLYLLDLAFFERALFARAQQAGAHLLLRLKSGTKLKVVGLDWSLSYWMQTQSRRRGTVYDIDVRWGRGRNAVVLRCVGMSLGGKAGVRFYLTTVPRSKMTARHIIEAYRLRWSIELLFRELKQSADIGRSATADPNALAALTYGAMLGHVLVRSLRITAALRHDVPLEQLRPLAVADVARAYATEIIAALLAPRATRWNALVVRIADDIVLFSRERKPSRSRPRITLKLGATGG